MIIRLARDYPDERAPTWFGYSLGKWDGDAFVVETLGFNDKSWLDARGRACRLRPHAPGAIPAQARA